MQDTPKSWFRVPDLWFGIGELVQVLPFQCKPSFRYATPVGEYEPTAQQLLADEHVTALRKLSTGLLPTASGRLGVDTCVQPSPSHFRISFPNGPRVAMKAPTAQQSRLDTQVTPPSVLKTPGLGTTRVAAFDASAPAAETSSIWTTGIAAIASAAARTPRRSRHVVPSIVMVNDTGAPV